MTSRAGDIGFKSRVHVWLSEARPAPVVHPMDPTTTAFELYIHPPIPGAPSLDPECIAVIAFLTRVLPHDAGLSIIAAYDASVSPSRTLPCLRQDDVCVHGGFRKFVKHFQLSGQGLDDGLDTRQQAEALALEHHLQSTAQPLLDYHLYMNRDNYSDVTHRVQSRYSYWPFGWLYPLHIYEKAERRAAAIGLVDQPSMKQRAANGSDDPLAGGHMEGSANPSLLFARSQKQQKKLKEQIGTARFKLQNAIDALCGPLEEAIFQNEGEYLIDGSVRSVDCLTYGYLSLLLHAEVADTSVAEELRKTWPRVARYADWPKEQLSSPQIEKLSSDTHDRIMSCEHSISLQSAPTISKRASVFFTSLVNLVLPPATRSQVHYTLRTLPVTTSLLILGTLVASTGLATFSYAAYCLLSRKIPRDALNQRDLVFARPRSGLGAMGTSGAALAALLGPSFSTIDAGSRMQQKRTESGGVRLTEDVRREESGGVEIAEIDVEHEGT